MSLGKNYCDGDFGNPRNGKDATGLRKVQFYYRCEALIEARDYKQAVKKLNHKLGVWERSIQTEKALWAADCNLTFTSKVVIQAPTLKKNEVKESTRGLERPRCGHLFNDLLLAQLKIKRGNMAKLGVVDHEEIEQKVEEELIYMQLDFPDNDGYEFTDDHITLSKPFPRIILSEKKTKKERR